MTKKTILDTNAIVHYILDDVPAQTAIVRETLANDEIVILPEVLAEVIYAFDGYYGKSREETAAVLKEFLDDNQYSDYVLELALKIYGTRNFDFVDCVLYSRSGEYNVLTFDKKLRKLINARAAL